MVTLKANKAIIAIETIVVCIVTYAALELTRHYLGREALWLLGLAGLGLSLFGLLRLRK